MFVIFCVIKQMKFPCFNRGITGISLELFLSRAHQEQHNQESWHTAKTPLFQRTFWQNFIANQPHDE